MAASVAAALAVAPRAQADEPSGEGDSGGATDTSSSSSSAAASSSTAAPAAATNDESSSDVLEQKGQSYYFLGLNYRGTVVPKFMVNLFVDEGATFYSNTAGISFDYRKDHFSIVPGLNFSEYGFDPVLFLQKGKNAADPGNWGVVHSTLKAIYLTVDLLWSVPLTKHGGADFEFGFGVGMGGIFGDLYNTWVTDQTQPAGTPSFMSSTGKPYYQCTMAAPAGGIAAGDGSFAQGCNTNNHQNATISKTGPGPGYREPNWFDQGGGSVPTVFPWLSLPILGFRFKPVKQIEARINGGFSVTGFFFNVALYYGFESTKSSPH